MKGKTKFMSMLLSTLMISTCFSSLVVKAAGAGTDIGPTPVGQPTTGVGVTSQEYEIKVPYYDDNVTDHYYELGSKDTQTVLSRVPNSITRTIQGQSVNFKAINVEFNEDDNTPKTMNNKFPKKVSHTLNINCGVMDYALYQYKNGGYSISASELQKNFKGIPMSAVDTAIAPGGGYNSNKMLVWRGDYSNDSLRNPIFACEPYQLFYPSIDGSSSQAQLRREPYDVTSDLTVKSTSMSQGLSYESQPITLDLPQGQNINSSQSYDFYAICSKDLSFTYSATDGTNTYLHTSYTTLSNPMTLSDLQYFYPDYSDSSYFFKNKLCSISGSQFKDVGTVTRTNIDGSTQAVHRYTTNYTFGYLEPSAVYTYTSLDHLYVPTVTYRGTLQTTVKKQDHNLTVNYIDTTGNNIGSTATVQYTPYTPSAPSGYSLTGNYRTSVTGTDIAYNGSINVDLSSSDQTIYVVCSKDSVTPVHQTGTVIERYFLDGVEQTSDRKEIDTVNVGSQTYYNDKSYPRYNCTNPTVTVDVAANSTVYVDFNFKFQNNPPTVTLNLPATVTLGDDLPVNAIGNDADGDNLTYSWNTPTGMYGVLTGAGGTVQFNNPCDVGQEKNFTVTVDDGHGGTATATATTKVVEPQPTVSINASGTLKENRKVTLTETSDGGSKRFPIDTSKIQWSFYDSNNNPINLTNTADSGIVESLDNSIGTSSMNVLFTKAGTYIVKCQVTNMHGDTSTDTKKITIAEDVKPVANISCNSSGYRDPNNYNRCTFYLTDSSYSSDGDSISKRVWVYSFDSNNNGTSDDDQWYVYNLDYSDQFGDHWQPITDNNGNVVKGKQALSLLEDSSYLDEINSGNLTNVTLIPKNIYRNGQWETHVGQYHFRELVRESFGQDTIQQLVTSRDLKIDTMWED